MKPRKSLRDTMLANKRALDDLAKISGKPAPNLEWCIPAERKPRAPSIKSDVPTEHQEQVALVKWFRAQFPKVKIFAVPNAALRSVELASYLKAEGMVAGVCDLWVPEWHMAIEMKRIKGSTISPEQHEWARYLAAIGWTHIFGYGFEDAKRKVLEAGK